MGVTVHIFVILILKATIEGDLKRLYCCYGNHFCQENDHNL